ncbi:23S rRNA (cytidine(2498)-2'-O)-methyltransferase RlmM [Marinomonas agarivorans]|nr:23S rRNA (cytidine(2498)-2'-O)-methyltransferase RlmM [Marinomonas agarivorans]
MKNILLYCRSGFETDCAAEITELAAMYGFYGYPEFKKKQGFVVFVMQEATAGEQLIQTLDWRELIFARQIIAVNELIRFESGGRVESLLEAAKKLPLAQDLWIETADTNEAKSLASLIKKLDKPLKGGWKKASLLRTKATGVRHHVFLLSGEAAYLGVSYHVCRSEFPLGIRRLKFPAKAPSRSTLKLEEAMHQFIPAKKWPLLLREGMTAVDLGAAPGGWTYQLVERGIQVIAIDNGPMQDNLMATGLVDHQKADGFKYQPQRQVDWLVCDMVEKPTMVAELMARWLAKGWTKRAIFNLKLPMKKRHEEVTNCLEIIRRSLKNAGREYEMQAKHLYHDREEITVCIICH